MVGGGRIVPEILDKLRNLFENADFQSIFARGVSAVTHEETSLTRKRGNGECIAA